MEENFQESNQRSLINLNIYIVLLESPEFLLNIACGQR